MLDIKLPSQCVLRNLTTHSDHRGALTEIFRKEWQTGIEPVQWNFVHSQPNVLRGVHVHVLHTDYLICVGGIMVLALVDVRPESPTHGLSTTVMLRGTHLQAISIPTGVAHGFYFPEPSSLIYSVSHYWNMADEIGCRWDDPVLDLNWQVTDPELSQRDRTAGSAADMIATFLSTRDQLNAVNA